MVRAINDIPEPILRELVEAVEEALDLGLPEKAGRKRLELALEDYKFAEVRRG